MTALGDMAREAWLYAIPLVEVANVRQRILARRAANTLVHNRHLTNAATQTVTSPNNDTLYSTGIIDLRDGPVELILPAAGDRYLSVALMDMYTNNFAVLGTRSTGPKGGHFVIAGPTGDAPHDAIRSPTDWVFILGRTLVDGADDLNAAHAVQDGLTIKGPASPAPDLAILPRNAPWRKYFTHVGALIVDSPPPVTDKALFDRIAALGLSRTGFNPSDFSATRIEEIEAGVAEARAIAAQSQLGMKIIDGWAYPPGNLGRFGQDYEFRAQIAVSGLFAMPLEEALYTRSVSDDPDGLFHSDQYRLHFAADTLPPVDGFWSMTLYEATPDGQFFFTPNSIDRYSIGNRTEGLDYNPDGSLDIFVSRADPGPRHRPNWLPAPGDKPFQLTMRAFIPQQTLLSGAYRFPPVRPITESRAGLAARR